MTPDRWKRIEDLLQSSLERKPAERAAFLAIACADDEDLRKEVESLLDSSEQDGSFLKSPAFEEAAALLAADNKNSMVGRRIGSYQIISPLGSGGMGEVYLAQDSRLGRKVAIKLLPPFFTKDEQRLRRFQQEARAASALNHPNIITMFDIGQVDSIHFIATEYIEGQTLRATLSGRKMKLNHAIDVAIQVASALAAAHQAGIVHRDIKPENIMLRPDGYVKVLDFGLAKLTQRTVSSTATEAPTIAQVDTDPGTVMGTASYMSPEQARGQSVDSRTDIFSLGVVLYEMIAGCVPFEGETTSHAIVSILEKEPSPLTKYAPEAPSELQRIVMKALRKDRDERYQVSKEMLNDLKDLKQEIDAHARLERSVSPESTSAETRRTSGEQSETESVVQMQTGEVASRTTSSAEIILSEIKRHKTGVTLALSALLIVAAGLAFGVYTLLNRETPSLPFQNIKATRLTTNGRAADAAISPDGKYVIYVRDYGSQQSLWVKQVLTSSDIQIAPPDEAGYKGLTFSKDGNYIYYVKRANDSPVPALYQMPTLGGAAKRLLDDIYSAVTFSPDGKQFAFLRAREDQDHENALMIANADGSAERKLASAHPPREFSNWHGQGPAWSPDGKSIACVVGGSNAGSDPMNLAEVQVADGTLKPITSRGWYLIRRVAWLADGGGLIIVAADKGSTYYANQVWHISYPSGEPRKVTADLNHYRSLSLTADAKSLSAVQSNRVSNIWVAPNGEAARATQIRFGGSNEEGIDGLAWTPDGRIVYYSRAGGGDDIWIMNADGTNQKQLTVDAVGNYQTAVTLDGRYIVFVSERSGAENIWRMNLDGSNPTQLTTHGDDRQPTCSPDGQWVVYTSGKRTLWKVSINGGEAAQLTDTPSERPSVSPDGNLIAYHYPDASESAKFAVIPFAGGKPMKIFDLPGSAELETLKWSQDGRALLYIDTRNGTSNLWSQPLNGGKPVQLSDFKSELLFDFAWSQNGRGLVCARGTRTADVVLISDLK